jgi:hypothetical protein
MHKIRLLGSGAALPKKACAICSYDEESIGCRIIYPETGPVSDDFRRGEVTFAFLSPKMLLQIAFGL